MELTWLRGAEGELEGGEAGGSAGEGQRVVVVEHRRHRWKTEENAFLRMAGRTVGRLNFHPLIPDPVIGLARLGKNLLPGLPSLLLARDLGQEGSLSTKKLKVWQT